MHYFIPSLDELLEVLALQESMIDVPLGNFISSRKILLNPKLRQVVFAVYDGFVET